MEEIISTGNQKVSVSLSELEEPDRLILFDWINDKKLVELNSFFKPVTIEAHTNWFNSIRQNKSVRIFGIRIIENNELIGSCQLFNINELNRAAELQIRLGSFDKMGKGYGSQAVQLLLHYGFENLNLQRIYLNVFADNIRAYKSYRKNGFAEEGHLRRAAYIGDRFVDVKVMSILKEEFPK
ncbi:MAG: GNAT family N-acetyltransferase [Bacteroidetes bacterium]|nr:GNAT family N-acetyltransferase [Bacteroidota bacterium]